MNNYLIPVDKANHFIVGTIIYCLALFMLSPVLALIPVMIAGGAKEAYDYYSGKGTPDIADFLYTVLGAIPVLMTHIIKL